MKNHRNVLSDTRPFGSLGHTAVAFVFAYAGSKLEAVIRKKLDQQARVLLFTDEEKQRDTTYKAEVLSDSRLAAFNARVRTINLCFPPR